MHIASNKFVHILYALRRFKYTVILFINKLHGTNDAPRRGCDVLFAVDSEPSVLYIIGHFLGVLMNATRCVVSSARCLWAVGAESPFKGRVRVLKGLDSVH